MVTISPSSSRHRNTHIINIVIPSTTWIEHDGFKRAVAQLASDGLWWIIPDRPVDEDKCPDVGPFDDADEASLMMNISMEAVIPNGV